MASAEVAGTVAAVGTVVGPATGVVLARPATVERVLLVLAVVEGDTLLGWCCVFTWRDWSFSCL